MKIRCFILISVFLTYSSLLKAESNHLTLGVFPYVSTSKIVIHNNVVRAHINDTTKYDLTLVTAKNLTTYVENVKKYKYDIIFCPPHLARFIEKKYNYQRVAMTSHKIRGVYITKKDSMIRSIDELQGKTISIAPAKTLLHQLALHQLKKRNINFGKNVNIKIIKTHNNAIYDILNNHSDVAVTGIKIWENFPKKVKINLKKLSQTEPVSGFVVLANPGLKKSSVKEIQQSLLLFNNTSFGKSYIFKGFKLIDDIEMKSLDVYANIFE